MDRTWTVSCAQYRVVVRAFDEREALELAAEKLGMEAVPCCHLEDPPCAACEAEDRATADMRAEDRGIDAARKDGRL